MKRIEGGLPVFWACKIGLPILAAAIILLCTTVQAQDETPKVTKPVPVVPQEKDKAEPKKKDDKREEKKEDSPPVVQPAGEEVGGVLPLGFVKNKLDAMPTGTKAYVNVEAVKCDSKRRVYLDPDQVYGTQNEGRVVLVSKDSGGYHLTLERVDHQWTCQELPPGVKWIPIKTVTSR